MSRCDHVYVYCRMWCSGFDPWGEALWWCPRCTGIDRQEGMGLVPITPRKPATCDACRKAIESGAQAWRGAAPPRNGLYFLGGVSTYRFCSACVDAMERVPIGKTRGQGAGLRLVAGGDG